MKIRTLSGHDELELFNRIPYVLNHELADDLADGRRKPEWMWVALEGEQLVGRLAYWGAGEPQVIDILDFDDLDVGVELLSAALETVGKADYSRFVPADWHSSPEPVRLRMAAVERLGGTLFVERLRLEWRAGTELPPLDPRLTFRPVEGRDELLSLMIPVLEGTLDAHDRDNLTRMTPAEAAADHFDGEFARFTTPREWWQVALADGEPVGFVVPARNSYNPIIAYIGVLPAFRGRGYINGILAQGTRTLAETGVERIRAATDVGNVPMAKAFERAGYVNFQRQIDMTW
ncbi:GNAT family N-acetyltransferase [Nonomuraea soli]|uniref:RimJ/RimL family protein N-acetyltransferase n=1 Tax=Nonomuraea soli TaxID=1032476 RepID=A0A7W0CSJ7_9ACTN|nr:GNAT family N-acetyltransferase [Nonomuraea soli]MBA2896442.1 RimJ/RimL family protein N-acetyltransferase [Nonomuraea soli]